MQSLFDEFKLDDGGLKRILNADNGLTFCIQVGEESLEDDEFSFLPASTNFSQSDEPEILLTDEEINEEEELARHEIVAEYVSDSELSNILEDKTENNIPKEKTSCTVLINENELSSQITDSFSSFNPPKFKDSGQSKGSHTGHFSDSSVNIELEGNVQYNIKKKGKRKNSKSGVKSSSKNSTLRPKTSKSNSSNDVVLTVMKNMFENQKRNFSGLKVMINPKTGQYVMRNKQLKSTNKESFPVEPWLIDKPVILRQPKENLFILPKSTNSSSNESIPQVPNSKIRSPSTQKASEIPIQKIHYIKGEKGSNPDPNLGPNSKVVYWEEGNIDHVKEPRTLSEKCIQKYFKHNMIDIQVNNCSIDIPEYWPKIANYESPILSRNGGAPGFTTYRSWEAVKERIEELQEETMTKFIFDYKTPTFKGDPQPFKKIYFELDTLRKDVEVVIPNNGVPFLFLGICVFTCHLGKRKWKSKELEDVDINRPLTTKKIGCPAYLSISRIARFPDFDMSQLSASAEKDVLREVKDAWDFSTSNVRYFIEYHVKEPKATDHIGHDAQYLNSNNRFKEPVDPRIIEKIRELTRDGYDGAKRIHLKIDRFIKEELFEGEENPPLDRRRYNPSRRDVRYAISKAKEELKKEGKSVIQLQCSALANDISNIVKTISQDQYLNQIKTHLNVLYKTIKAKEPLEPYLLLSGHMDSQDLSLSPPTMKRTYKKRKVDFPMGSYNEKDLLIDQPDLLHDQVIEQFYINVPDANESVFNGQLYAPEFVDINHGLVEPLQQPEENAVTEVTEVYYYYPDGACELATPASLANVQP